MQLAPKAADPVSEKSRVIKSRDGREPKQLLLDLPFHPGVGAVSLRGVNLGLAAYLATIAV
jgi:hypothetical protein